MKTLFYFKLIFCLTFFISGFPQDGSPDMSFGNNGIVETDIEGGFDYAYGVTQTPSGRIVVVGVTYDPNTFEERMVIVAYLEDGTIDTSFGLDGFIVEEIGVYKTYRDIISQSDEKLIAISNYAPEFELTRLLPNGNIDTNYGDNGYLTTIPGGVNNDVFLTEDDELLSFGGKIIDNIPKIVLKKFQYNGMVDTSFGDNGSVIFAFGNESNIPKGSIHLSGEGKIVLGGKIIDNGIESNIVFKCLPNGNLDLDFGIDGVAFLPVDNSYNCSPLTFHDNKILVNCFNPDDRFMMKLNEQGELDIGFGNGGYLDYYDLIAFHIQENNRILAFDAYMDWEGGITLSFVRFFNDGFIDQSFNYQTNYSELETFDLNIQNSGELLIAGTSVWYNGNNDIVLQQYNNNPLGFSEFNLKSLGAYPNPSNGIFNITTNRLYDTAIEFQVTDLTGKLIQKGVLEEITTKLDLSAYQNGMYFFNAGWITLKLIKE